MKGRFGISKELIERLNRHKKTYGYPTIETMLHEMLDIYEMRDAHTLHIIHRRLRNRIPKGINPAFISELRLMYTYLGHILQRIRAL